MKKSGLLWVLFILLAFLPGCGDAPAPARREPERGGAPARQPVNGEVLFRLPGLDGREVTVRGPTALFFFTSWCAYCKQVMPDVKRLADQAHRQGWRVYGINVSESADKAQWFVQNYQTNFPVLLDQSGRVADQFGLVGFPTFILLDQNGRTIYDGHTIPQNF